MNQDVLDYRRVERAIRYLEEHRSGQPDLEAVANHVGLSKYHFHRLFRRWAGTTPKRFLEHLTVEHARALLEDSEPVLRTAHRSGLSGGGRLHDHFVRVEAATPGQVRRGGDGLRIRTGVHPSPFGEILLAATDRGICFLAFLPDADAPERTEAEAEARADLERRWPRARIALAPEATAPLARRAFRIPDVDPSDDPLPLHLQGTNFQLQVWRALLRIPPGRVASYGSLARLVGRPHAARAVGGAVGANPVAYLIPCHRVIRSGGAIGSYRWSASRKRAILGWEGGRNPA